jgi:hypothetical protein
MCRAGLRPDLQLGEGAPASADEIADAIDVDHGFFFAEAVDETFELADHEASLFALR